MVGALGNRACIFSRLGRYDDAIKDLRRIVESDPKNLMALKHLGSNYERKEDSANAVRFYRKALRLEKDKPARKRIEAEIRKIERSLASR